MTLTVEGLPSPHLQRKIQEVQLFLARNLAQDVDLSAIAAHAALSPYYFTRQFTAMVGMPPYRYLISLRIQRAALLLRDSDLTVTQILHRVGFHSPSHFTTTFRRHMGMSPTDYRRRYDFERNANRFSRALDPLVHQPEQRLTR
jgi:AraC family transcriptional regulator